MRTQDFHMYMYVLKRANLYAPTLCVWGIKNLKQYQEVHSILILIIQRVIYTYKTVRKSAFMNTFKPEVLQLKLSFKEQTECTSWHCAWCSCK